MSVNLIKMLTGINKAKAAIVDAQSKKTRQVAIAVHQTVVIATPVDKGCARGNWLPNVGSPITTPRLDARDKSGAAIIAEGRGVIARAKPTDKIHFTNNLDYIGALNDGHSAQAPAGFIQKAIRAAEASV